MITKGKPTMATTIQNAASPTTDAPNYYSADEQATIDGLAAEYAELQKQAASVSAAGCEALGTKDAIECLASEWTDWAAYRGKAPTVEVWITIEAGSMADVAKQLEKLLAVVRKEC